jgi:hypothetical protein
MREGAAMSEIQSLPGAVKTDAGVKVNGVVCQPIVDKCDGCDRIRGFEDQKYCVSYPVPAGKWRMGGRCNFATHIQKEAAKAVKVNPLKASKRAAAGK